MDLDLGGRTLLAYLSVCLTPCRSRAATGGHEGCRTQGCPEWCECAANRARRAQARAGGVSRVLVVALGCKARRDPPRGRLFPTCALPVPHPQPWHKTRAVVGVLACVASIVTCLCSEGHCVPWDSMGDDNLHCLASVYYSHRLVGLQLQAGAPAAWQDIYSRAPAHRKGLHAMPHLGGGPQNANDK